MAGSEEVEVDSLEVVEAASDVVGVEDEGEPILLAHFLTDPRWPVLISR